MSARRSSSISAALLAIVLLTTARFALSQTESQSLLRGEALFLGKADLLGKPRDHREFLPPSVVRCVNCHGQAGSGSDSKVTLDSAFLLQLRSRRGGPPSAYDRTKFCKLLHTGIDPVYITIDHAMPVYEMPDTDCAALWSYLTRKEIQHGNP